MAFKNPEIAAATAGSAGPAPALPDRPSAGRSHLIAWVSAAIVIGLLVFSWIDVSGSVTALVHGLFAKKGLFRYVIPVESLPPNLSAFGGGVRAAVTTLAIAVLSIAFGVVFSLMMLPLAARNISPSTPVYALTRFIQAVFRAIPELIMLLMFQIVLGFSPFSAVVALTVHGTGVKGKLFAEAVEEMDMTAVDALRVAGAGRVQVFLHAVLPGVRTTLLGLTLYRLDANFRSAVTLGAVGGGGIGFLIDNALNDFQFKVVATYLIVLVIVVMAIEQLSALLRARLT